MVTRSDSTDPESRIVIHLEYTRFVNFAMQQNAVPLIRGLVIQNPTPDIMTELRVRIWSDPLVFEEKTLYIETIPAHSSQTVSDLSLTLLREPLRRQSEREEGQLWIEATGAQLPVHRHSYPLSVLAYNEWFGISTLPEIIAAHVLPNDPAVERILAHASRLLQERKIDGSLSGYQSSDPRSVYTQVAAIYFAASQQNISYINPPASFENTGQKIRTPEHILDRKLGTCLDTTVLLAACFEQAGLRPVVVFIKGHSFPGVWLVEKSFDDPATRYGSILLNRIGLGEFLVIESTTITRTPAVSFKITQEQAKEHLHDESRFQFAVDIHAARRLGIRPLCLTETAAVADNHHPDSSSGDVIFTEFPFNQESPESIDQVDDLRTKRNQETPRDRLNRWKTNLLDLSLRNRLLNFRESKKAIPLLCPDIASLEDGLAADAIFRVRPRPDAWGDQDPRNAALHREQTGQNALSDYLKQELDQKRIHAAIPENELAARLIHIEREARLGLDEGGANTLFLALGFLVWTEPGKQDTPRRAPILLIPMSIERKSIRDGFRIHRIDEETRINITLLQKLKTDFSIAIDGLDPLPEDASGLDVQRILLTIRNAIKREPGWKVVEESCLSIFTFSKFFMWQDLEANADQLRQNAVVRHLIESSNEAYEPVAPFPELDTLDTTYPPSGIFCPLPADSSQLRAVLAAAEGRTFILQGPPGTGKSQTITNLIAHCLTLGKRVLFVAQKRAALDVVHKRLADIGLGPFCLELHSNKTTKESFRNQLRDAFHITDTGANHRWEAETGHLSTLRQNLNHYIEDLHLSRAFTKSAYWAISRLIGHAGSVKVPLKLKDYHHRTGTDYDQIVRAVQEVMEAVRICGNPAGHPLKAVRLTEWVYGIDDDAMRAIQDIQTPLAALQTVATSLLPIVSLDPSTLSRSDAGLILQVFKKLESVPPVTRPILADADWPAIQTLLEQWIRHARECSQTRARLFEKFTPDLLILDLPDLIEKLHTRKTSWFLKRWRLGSVVRKTLRSVSNDQKRKMDWNILEENLNTALALRMNIAKLDERNDFLSKYFGSFWQGLDSDWINLDHVIEWAGAYRILLDEAPGATPQEKTKQRTTWIDMAVEHPQTFSPNNPNGQAAGAFRDLFHQLETARAHLETILHLDPALAWGGETQSGMIGRMETACRSLSEHLPQLREWAYYQKARVKAVDHELNDIIDALENGTIGADRLDDIFEHSFADWWIRTILRSIPSLSGFIGKQHDLKIREFQAQEAKIARLTQTESFSRIAQGLPRLIASSQRTPASSESGILQRFVQGGRKTIRQIFKECPNALARCKPCVLMSPLSVAQFIGVDFPRFDMIVFDEASQMPTYEAIGAIARGHQLIVVGDSRQLPPTTFFERMKADEDIVEEDLPEEMESILDESEAAGLTPLRLDWHYRSRHESLIAFSNRQYYENRLLTFPAAIAEDTWLGVQWREVPDGVYDHGKTRTNRPEAERVVAEIVQRLRDPLRQNESMGVVTFSTAQQTLVEDLLDAARGQTPDIEPFFTGVHEPVFVKNLETVQGDERDVILFSICYGPDANGVVRMNFGPLNNKGGERRLNVAITRARKQLLVFSTIRPEQIDLSRTKSTGVHHLRAFLDYARRGPIALQDSDPHHNPVTDEPFEQSICSELVRLGYSVDRQVGCSGYRIDLAVRDPDAPGRYLLGIECDGKNYCSAKSARDRDWIRQRVLEGLGWRLQRIWSNDWWLQRPIELTKIQHALQEAMNSRTITTPQDVDPPPDLRFPQAEPVPEPSDSTYRQRTVFTPTHHSDCGLSGMEFPVELKLPGQTEYTRYDATRHTFTGSFHDPANGAKIARLMDAIIKVEAPILLDTLCSRVAACWGLKRTGSRIREIIERAVQAHGYPIRRSGEREFIWTQALVTQKYEIFRVDSETGRPVGEICPEEIANAAAQVMLLHFSMTVDDLVRETARVFGIRRLTSGGRCAIEEGVYLICKTGICRLDGDMVIKV